MPIVKQPVRILQKSSKKAIFINLSEEDTGWRAGDVIKYEKVDDDTIILKRMH